MSNISTIQSNQPTTSIGLRKFRENIDEVVKSLADGRTLTVYKRSKPLFTITKPAVDEWGDEGHWTNFDFRSKKYPSGIPIDDFIDRLEKYNEQHNG